MECVRERFYLEFLRVCISIPNHYSKNYSSRNTSTRMTCDFVLFQNFLYSEQFPLHNFSLNNWRQRLYACSSIRKNAVRLFNIGAGQYYQDDTLTNQSCRNSELGLMFSMLSFQYIYIYFKTGV